METAGKLAGFAVCAALVALILRRLRPEAGWGVSLGAGAIVLLAALPALSALVRGIASLSAMSGLDDSFMQQLLKIAGLSLLLDFAAQTCRDAQEEALALKVEFAGRVLLLSSALPSCRRALLSPACVAAAVLTAGIRRIGRGLESLSSGISTIVSAAWTAPRWIRPLERRPASRKPAVFRQTLTHHCACGRNDHRLPADRRFALAAILLLPCGKVSGS